MAREVLNESSAKQSLRGGMDCKAQTEALANASARMCNAADRPNPQMNALLGLVQTFPRLALLASGRGSNVQAIIDAVTAGTLAAEIVGVFSDSADAWALERARKANLPAHALSPKGFANRAAFDQALFAQIDASAPDLIVCAGYMRVIGAAEVTPRYGRIINIHPSLLPHFKGLHTHQQALDAGVAEHGASVHYVSAELDAGPVISQVRVPVLPGDDAEQLAARVLAHEHPLLVASLRLLAEGAITLGEDGVYLNKNRLLTPLQLADTGFFV